MDHPIKRKIRAFFRKVVAFFTEDALNPLPIRRTLAHYSPAKARADFRASLNVVMLTVPQGMAYAAIAELPIVFGIVCSAVASLVAPLFASSKYTCLGPTNATALMVYTTMAGLHHLSAYERLGLMPMLVLMIGAICFIGALIKVADLLQFISHSVLVGYITGAAYLIIASQLKHLFGVAEGFQSNGTFVGTANVLLSRAGDFDWALCAFGIGTLLVYLVLQRYLKGWPVFALVLVLASLLGVTLTRLSPAWAESLVFFEPFAIADLAPRAPELLSQGFFHTLSLLLAPAFAVAFLASLENSVMAKSLAARTGGRPDVNQDMLAVGMANLACACTAAMPASGSLTRSALNFESGARTGVASLMTGALCVIATALLAGLPLISSWQNPVAYVPKVA
ncbi:MAG: SulP family inorganic anion transporter, partial [Verrucomicrobiales bacterium]